MSSVLSDGLPFRRVLGTENCGRWVVLGRQHAGMSYLQLVRGEVDTSYAVPRASGPTIDDAGDQAIAGIDYRIANKDIAAVKKALALGVAQEKWRRKTEIYDACIL